MISVAENLDFEKEKNYILTIRATDGGDPPLINIAKVNITITDINDNKPVFRQVSYSAKIMENSDVGEKVIQVRIGIAHTKYSFIMAHHCGIGNYIRYNFSSIR